jgi:hypothetical protein
VAPERSGRYKANLVILRGRRGKRTHLQALGALATTIPWGAYQTSFGLEHTNIVAINVIVKVKIYLAAVADPD